MAKRKKLAGSIALYGNREIGAGFLWRENAPLARSKSGGDGEPKSWRSFNDAVWLAGAEMVAAGLSGRVSIFAPGGMRVAIAELGRLPYYGDLKWEMAPVFVVPMESVVNAAEKG